MLWDVLSVSEVAVSQFVSGEVRSALQLGFMSQLQNTE